MNSKWLNYQLNDWDKYKKICFILNILSNCFFLFPFFITRNNFKQLFYILSFIFSNLYHNDLCNDGNSNLSGHVRVFKYREYTQSESDSNAYYYQSQTQNSS